MRRGFSFIEVIVSVLLVSIGLLALLKLDAFSKWELERLQKRHRDLMMVSGYQFVKKRDDSMNLEEIYDFKGLSRSDRQLLESIDIEASYEDLGDSDIFQGYGEDFSMEIERRTFKHASDGVSFYGVRE